MRRNYTMLIGKGNYHHRRHNKTKLLVHLIFVTKYRKPLLTGGLSADVKQLLFESSKRHHWYIKRMETDKDHIHILLQYPPADSMRFIASTPKQESAHYIWETHHGIKKYYWAEHTLWSDGYFAANTGDASSETIENYIAS